MQANIQAAQPSEEMERRADYGTRHSQVISSFSTTAKEQTAKNEQQQDQKQDCTNMEAAQPVYSSLASLPEESNQVPDGLKVADQLPTQVISRVGKEEISSRPISTCSIASTGSSKTSVSVEAPKPTARMNPAGSFKAVVNSSASASFGARPGSNKRKVCELKCSEVRWFYKRDTDTKWTPFKGYDSTVLELAYRKHNSIPLDEMLQSHREELPQTEEVIVLNGLYQLTVDKDASHFDEISSVYWKEDTMQIRRGTWFSTDGSLQPEQVELADKIEEHHLKNFRGQIIPDSPVFSETETSKKPVLTSLKWGENHEVRWNSVIDVSIVNIKRGYLVNLFTRGKGTTYLRRGYNEETRFEDGRPNFSDLILVVHGIGQKGYENLIAKNTSQIRDEIVHLMEKNYPDETRRPVILPIEWRSPLLLDNGLSDAVTLPRMSTVRTTLNSVALDIMYYQSPLYRTEIINGVIATLNNVYTIFMKNNPTFDGAVSIFAHSLGCVISYDILTNWSPFLLYDEFVTNAIKDYIKKDEAAEDEKELLESFYNSRKKLLDKGGAMKKILVRQEQQLKFKVKYLFCIGSPLAVFIIMRGAENKTILPQTDQVERIFNIFHPYDPVAFRLEPLFHENYRYIRPLKVLSYGEARQSYDDMIYQCHKSYLKKKKKGKLPTDKSESDNKPSADDKNGDTNDSDSDYDCEVVQAGELQNNLKAPSAEEIAAHTREGNPSTPSSNSKKLWSKAKSTSKEDKKYEAKPVKPDAKSNKTQDITPPRPPPPNVQPAGSFNGGQPTATAANDKKSAEYLKKKMGEACDLIDEITMEKRAPIRLDYSLQPALTDKSYWSMLKSHFAYWTNPDVTNFVLNTIYQEPLTPADA